MIKVKQKEFDKAVEKCKELKKKDELWVTTIDVEDTIYSVTKDESSFEFHNDHETIVVHNPNNVKAVVKQFFKEIGAVKQI